MTNNNIYFGRNSFRFLYFRYKDTPYYGISIIALSIVISLVLLIQVIIPQLNNWFSIRNEVIATQEKIQNIKDNINYMSTINRTFVDDQLNTATTALPPEKDFGAILTVLSDAALNSGISLENYSFELGDIASTSAKQNESDLGGVSTVNVNIVTRGSLDKIQNFVREVQQKLPLSEVANVEGDVDAVSVSLVFYQKSFTRHSPDPEQHYPKISDNNEAVLNKLSGWKSASNVQDIGNINNGSGSAVPLF